MLNVIGPLIVFLIFAVATFVGGVSIANGGFIRFALGALLVALGGSIFLSTTAAVLLEASSGFSTTSAPATLARSILAGFVQPTLSGIILLAVLVVLAWSAARASGLVEDIRILLDCHKAVASSLNEQQSGGH